MKRLLVLLAVVPCLMALSALGRPSSRGRAVAQAAEPRTVLFEIHDSS